MTGSPGLRAKDFRRIALGTLGEAMTLAGRNIARLASKRTIAKKR